MLRCNIEHRTSQRKYRRRTPPVGFSAPNLSAAVCRRGCGLRAPSLLLTRQVRASCHWTFVAPNRRLTAGWATRGGATQLWRGWSLGVVQVRAMYACVLVNIGVCGAGDNQIQQRHYYSAKARTFPAATAECPVAVATARTPCLRAVHGALSVSSAARRRGAQGDPAAKHRAALGRALSPLDGSFW